MTSLKQIEANRRNALRSTGPTSEDGKQRAARNAVRPAEWAKRIIPIKNTLNAHEVEAALEITLAQVGDGAGEASQASAGRTDAASPPSTVKANPASLVASPALRPTAVLNFEDYPVTPKTRRRRDKRHREFVAAQGCVICGCQPSDAHHLRFA